MNTYDFKNDLTGSVFRLMGQLLKPFTLFMIIYLVIISAFTALLVPSGFGEFISELISDVQSNAGDPMAGVKMNAAFVEYFMDNLLNMGLLIFIIFLVGMMSYNYYFNMAEEVVENENNSFQSGFANLLDTRILHYFLVYLIITVIYQGLSMVLQSVITNQLILMLVSFIFSITVGGVYGWFHLAYAQVGLGNSTFIEAFKATAAKMTTIRVVKTVGISFLFFICAGIALGLLGGIAFALVSFIPYVGILLGLILGSFALGLIMAFAIAGASGLYYRYNGQDQKTNEEQFVVTD